MTRIVIKIGSQTIVDAHGALNVHRLTDFIRQIAALKHSGHDVVLVTSGAVASGLGMLRQNKPLHCTSDVVHRQILASLGQAKLIETYNWILAHHELLASQILLTKQDFKTKVHFENIACLFIELLQQKHILPIVNENDTVAVTELMFTDNDELASLVADQIKARQLVILTNVAGVYDKDPANPGAFVIPVIDSKRGNWPKISASKSDHGRGGMSSKLATAKKMASLGIITHIASAAERDVLLRIIQQGESVGTKII